MSPYEIQEALAVRSNAKRAFRRSSWKRWVIRVCGSCAWPFMWGLFGVTRFDGPLIIAWICWSIGWFVVPDRLYRAAAWRWLARLDLPLDVMSYLDALDLRSRLGQLVVEVQLASDTTVPVDQVEVPVALIGVTGNLNIVPGTVTITGRALNTFWYGSYGSYPSNWRLHDWFRRVVDRTLVPLARRYPIKTIVVRNIGLPDK